MSGVRSIVSRLKHADRGRLQDIRWCPTQFQQYIPGRDFRVHTVADEVFANQAGNHAAPATMRVRIAHLAVEENVGFAGNAELGMPFPEVAKFRIPARIFVLEPLEVLLVWASMRQKFTDQPTVKNCAVLWT